MAASNVSKTKEKVHSYYDVNLLFLTLCLVGFGLLMIYSASSYTAQVNSGDPASFVKKQAFCAVLGLAAMIAVSKINYRIYIRRIFRIKPITLLYIISAGMQIFVLAVGTETKGAKRWIDLGFTKFQPSEITKIAVIMVAAYIIYKAPRKISTLKGAIAYFLILAPLIGLVAVENLSTGIILCAIAFGMAFVASKKKIPYILLAVVVVILIALFIVFGEGFRMERIQIMQQVETHPKGYQILQGLYAIASGGLFGTGLGESMQKLGFIPESHNDMIFSIICEELGLVGAAIVILIFILLIWRIFSIAISSPDLFGGMMCTGIMIHIASQVVINIAVVTNSIPSTGIPLPFISYGGTSIIIIMAEMGLVLAVSNQIRRKY